MGIIETVYERERDRLDSFLLSENTIVIPPMPEVVTEQSLARWNALGLDLHFLPTLTVSVSMPVPDWYVLPQGNFFREIAAGNIADSTASVPEHWLLVERFPKPRGSRLWLSKKEFGWLGTSVRDFLAKTQRSAFHNDPLRDALKERGYSGRACLSFSEIQELTSQAARVFHAPSASLRLPRFAEYNMLGNIWYPQWKATNTWEWLDDRHGTKERLVSGSKSVGTVGWDPEDHWSTRLGFRFVAEL